MHKLCALTNDRLAFVVFGICFFFTFIWSSIIRMTYAKLIAHLHLRKTENKQVVKIAVKTASVK